MKQWDCTECELLDGGMLFCMGVCLGFVHIECNKQHQEQIVISMRTGMLVDSTKQEISWDQIVKILNYAKAIWMYQFCKYCCAMTCVCSIICIISASCYSEVNLHSFVKLFKFCGTRKCTLRLALDGTFRGATECG